jgi:hypothetical protein
MNFKGISLLAICLASAVSAQALEERIVLLPGAKGAVGDWEADGAVLRKGFKGSRDYVIADSSYQSDGSADLLLHFDAPSDADSTGRWALRPARSFALHADGALLGASSARFNGPDSALSLIPGPESLFGRDSSFRDFSIEFWLYPANADNGEVILLWQSLRKLPSGILPQQLSCAVTGGRLQWSFAGFFSRPYSGGRAAAAKAAGQAKAGPAKARGASPADADTRIELRGRSALVPRAWSHHLLRFDGDTGLLEYLVNGRPEATAYATATGHEGGTVYEPIVGAPAPLKFCPEYSGLADELRISGRFVDQPSLKPFGRDPSLVVSPVADLGFGNSRLVAVDAQYKAPGTSSVEFAYRIADSWAAWRSGEAVWTPLRPGEALPETARGRYVQVKAELYPDGTGRITPALSSITLRYEPDPPPPAPARLIAYPKNGAVELHWTRVPEADLGGYLVYYGERPGEYFGAGADQGPSPIDAGNATTLTLTGIPNGRLLYFVVAAYDSGPDPDASIPGAASRSGAVSEAPGAALDTRRAESRAGEFSPETAARPSRTAK